MEFIVYDNIYTYHKRMPATKHNPDTHLKVKQIAITENGAFWFETDFKRESTNVEINKPYVHIHQGIQSISKMQFDKDPSFIEMQKITYNPKNRLIEIKKPGGWPWSKPIFIKEATYYGVKIPPNKKKVLGDWLYDYPNNRMSIILNYYPGYPNTKYQAS